MINADLEWCPYCNRSRAVPCKNTRDMDPVDGFNSDPLCNAALVELGGGERGFGAPGMSEVSTDDRDIDLVERLRLGGPNAEAVSGQAADEIERLREFESASISVDAAVALAAAAEREACASLIANMPMADILLAGGEMTAQERRTVRAMQAWFANRIRARGAP